MVWFEYPIVGCIIALVHMLIGFMFIQMMKLLMHLSHRKGQYRVSYLISPWADVFLVAFVTGNLAHLISITSKIFIFKW